MTPILITGTDTGVGKTHVTVGLVRALRARGARPFALKPIETGCDDLRAPADGLALANALGRPELLDLIVPLRLRLPAAPMTAAEREGVVLGESSILRSVQRAATLGAPLLIEGAGGLLVPITATLSYAELAQRCGARVVIVARDALGTLNHTRLTLLAAKHYGLDVIAVVLNATASAPDAALDHAGALRRLTDVTVLGPLAWGADAMGEVERVGLVDRL